MDKIVVHMSRAAHRDIDFIEGLVHMHPMQCTSLLSLLRREAVDELGLLLIDTEGLDCEIVAAQNWASPEWCANSPAAIVFEWKHCTPEAYSRALRALERSEECPDEREGTKSSPFRVVAETEENVFLTRVPRDYWKPVADPSSSKGAAARQGRSLDKPLSLLKHKASGDLGKAAREKASSSHFQQFSTLQCPTVVSMNRSAAPLPPGEERLDSGRKSYINRLFRTTTWSRPRAEEAPVYPSVNVPPAPAADPSQPRWQACLKQVPGQFEGQSVYDAVIERVLLKEPTHHHIVLELGALMGQGSCYMSHRLQAIARSHSVQSSFTVVDIWGPVEYYRWLKLFHFYEQWDALVSVSQAVQGNDTASIRPVWEHFMCASGAVAAITSHIQGSAKDRTVGALFADESISFVYLDTTHQYADTIEELTVWWPKVRRGGWLCGDDYNERLFPMPRAIRYWKKAHAIQEPVEIWTAVRNVTGTVTNSQFCIGKGVPARPVNVI